MIKTIDIKQGVKLDDYESYATLAGPVRELRTEARIKTQKLENRKIWIINSAEKGGGVAEMLPREVSLFRQLGLTVDWLVIQPEHPGFFDLTKRIHILIHGNGEPDLNKEDQELYEKVSRECAEALLPKLNSEDIVVIHDPQPFGMAKFLQGKDVSFIWRCHIGYETHNEQTRAAWAFLKPYASFYHHAVFTTPEYIPDFFTGISTVLFPSIDPLSHKNRNLHIHKLVGILCNGQILEECHPVLTPPFPSPVKRLRHDGKFIRAHEAGKTDLLYSPVVTQISRWDPLKGFLPLMDAFVDLKQSIKKYSKPSSRHRKRLELLKLVLGGPDPLSIQDDPGAIEFIDEVIDKYKSLPEDIRKDIVILSLPMDSVKYNALLVNALQRCSTVVVQNSLREGFGLTATEAMWKNIPVMVSNACGLRHQVRDKIDGRIVHDAEDCHEVASTLSQMLKDPKVREVWAYNGQKRVHDNFLIFNAIGNWLDLFDQM